MPRRTINATGTPAQRSRAWGPIRPLTEDVEEWLKENVAEDAQWFGSALVVEPRYLAPLVEGMFEEGFAIQ